jgi:trehalose 6-phosphate phosphatase
LLLDLDGTLAPIAATPNQAEVPAGSLAAISQLAMDGWAVSIVSGRPAAEARKMIPLKGVGFFGSHGLEGPIRRSARQRSKTTAAIRRLKSLSTPGRRLARRFEGAILELKPAGLAFHHRNIRPGQMRAWRGELDSLLSSSNLTGIELLRGKCVLELRPAGVNKGMVVASELAHRKAGKRDASIIAIGDDTTDEDMFRAIRGKGIGVKVGRGTVKTQATRRLPSPAAVARFLAGIARNSEKQD